jgi:hypothetical protein
MNARLLLSVTLAFAASSAAAGCRDRCGQGYELQNHLCVALPSVDGGGGAGGSDGGGEEGGAPACEPTFGEACLGSTECGCDATFCAGYPGEVGVCTRTGCLEDPSVCPPDWSCMDLAEFGLPSICVPPA